MASQSFLGGRWFELTPRIRLLFYQMRFKLGTTSVVLLLGGKPKSLRQVDSLPEDLKEHVTLFRRSENFQKLGKVASSS